MQAARTGLRVSDTLLWRGGPSVPPQPRNGVYPGWSSLHSGWEASSLLDEQPTCAASYLPEGLHPPFHPMPACRRLRCLHSGVRASALGSPVAVSCRSHCEQHAAGLPPQRVPPFWVVTASSAVCLFGSGFLHGQPEELQGCPRGGLSLAHLQSLAFHTAVSAVESQLAHWGSDQGRATHVNAIDHLCHHMKMVKNFKCAPKDTVCSSTELCQGEVHTFHSLVR